MKLFILYAGLLFTLAFYLSGNLGLTPLDHGSNGYRFAMGDR